MERRYVMMAYFRRKLLQFSKPAKRLKGFIELKGKIRRSKWPWKHFVVFPNLQKYMHAYIRVRNMKQIPEPPRIIRV